MKTKNIIYAILAMIFLLAACSPQQVATVDPNAINQQIETSVALTVSAADALTLEAQPTATLAPVEPPTSTAFPTLTPFATITPFVLTPSGGSGGSGSSGGSGGSSGSGGTVYYGGEQCGTSANYMAVIVDQRPHDGSPETIRKTGETEKLDVYWTLKNVGTKTWLDTWSWVVYDEVVNSDLLANQVLSLSPTPIGGPLGVAVDTGESITLGVELTMPANFEGRNPIYFTVQMALVGDGVKFCRPWINIELIRPGMTP